MRRIKYDSSFAIIEKLFSNVYRKSVNTAGSIILVYELKTETKSTYKQRLRVRSKKTHNAKKARILQKLIMHST